MAAKSLTGPTETLRIKRILRHRQSQQYFKVGGWTSNPAEAQIFSDVVEVARTCVRYGLTDVELALRLDCNAGDVFCTSIR